MVVTPFPCANAFGGHLGGSIGVALESYRWSGQRTRPYDFLEATLMAWLEVHPTSGHFKVCLRWGRRKIKKTIKTADRGAAETALARFNENLNLLERGRLELPTGADIGTFLLSDGKLTGQPAASPRPQPLALGELRDTY